MLTIFEVRVDPCTFCFLGSRLLICVGAVQLACKGVVEALFLDNNFNGRIFRPFKLVSFVTPSTDSLNVPFQAKEPSHPVFRRFKHAILRLSQVSCILEPLSIVG